MNKQDEIPIKIDPVKVINPSILQTFPFHMEDVIINSKNGNIQCTIKEVPKSAHKYSEPQTIQISTSEFSAVCPFSGLPDIGELIIEYIPNQLCVELKSLKYYLLTYRNVGIYQEHATTKIFTDLNKVLEPEYLQVTLTYNIRGGMLTRCEMKTDCRENKGEKNGKE